MHILQCLGPAEKLHPETALYSTITELVHINTSTQALQAL